MTSPFSVRPFFYRIVIDSDRLNVLSRSIAAIFVGYLFTFSVATLLSFILPLPKSEAVMTATLASFLIYAGAIIWAFSAATVKHVWLGLWIPTVVAGAIAMIIHLLGGHV